MNLDGELAAKLWALGADQTGPVFRTRSGRRHADRNVRRVLDAACKRAGVVGTSFHTFTPTARC
jgi:hypothetical protein